METRMECESHGLKTNGVWAAHEVEGISLDALGEGDDRNTLGDQRRHLAQHLARELHRDGVKDEIGIAKSARRIGGRIHCGR